MIKQIIIFIMIITFSFSTSYGFKNVNNTQANLENKIISLYQNIKKQIAIKVNNDLEQEYIYYKKLKSQLEKYTGNKNIKQILLGLTNKEINNLNIKIKEQYQTTQEIIIGYTEQGTPIKAFYKGNPNKKFFGIFADIHGGYEYGTYLTALSLKKKMEQEDKEQWFIIPSINPDGLKTASKKNYKKSYYLKGRANYIGVDLNRNFCTKSFELKKYIKYAPGKESVNLKTGINGCNDQKETKAILSILKKYKFSSIISLHSQGKVLYIPTNSFEDKMILTFTNKIKTILPSFDYNLSYKNKEQKKAKIKKYEINSFEQNKYSGTMETYIYEQYNIPVLIIELSTHGEDDEELLSLTNLIKKTSIVRR